MIAQHIVAGSLNVAKPAKQGLRLRRLTGILEKTCERVLDFAMTFKDTVCEMIQPQFRMMTMIGLLPKLRALGQS